MKWYIWNCDSCPNVMTINYYATEEDFLRFKDCLCGGTYHWVRDEDIPDRLQA